MNDREIDMIEGIVDNVVVSCKRLDMDPMDAMFLLMYPVFDWPTGRSCEIEDCPCGGENQEIALVSSAVN